MPLKFPDNINLSFKIILLETISNFTSISFLAINFSLLIRSLAKWDISTNFPSIFKFNLSFSFSTKIDLAIKFLEYMFVISIKLDCLKVIYENYYHIFQKKFCYGVSNSSDMCLVLLICPAGGFFCCTMVQVT